MAFAMTDIQEVDLTFKALTAAGNPARFEGAPEWSSSDPSILTVFVDPAGDPMIATVRTVGPLGAAQIKVVVDADLGEGVRHLTGILDIEVLASEAVSLNLTAGEPRSRI